MATDNPNYQQPLPLAIENFYLVIYERGPNRPEPQNDAQRERLEKQQMAHLAFLKDLYDRGLSVGAGPFTDEQGGGLLILRAESLSREDVDKLMQGDAHVQTGRLVARVRPFFTAKGVF